MRPLTAEAFWLGGQYAQDEHRRLERERFDQVSKVALWFFRGTYVWGVHVVNASGLPVLNMAVNFSSSNPAFSEVIYRGTQGRCKPNRSAKLTNALRYILEMYGALNMHPEDLEVEITFTDSTGAHWRIEAHGVRREIAAPLQVPTPRGAHVREKWTGDVVERTHQVLDYRCDPNSIQELALRPGLNVRASAYDEIGHTAATAGHTAHYRSQRVDAVG